MAVEVDVGNRDDVERLAQTVIDRFGRIAMAAWREGMVQRRRGAASSETDAA